jgi:hypothetical protein
MKCIRCDTKNSLKECKENSGICKSCGYEFVFDPAAIDFNSKITDDLFEKLITNVSVGGTLYFTKIQLYYLLEKRLRSNLDQNNQIVSYFCWGALFVCGSIWIANLLKLDIAFVISASIILCTIFTITVVAQTAISRQVNRQIRQTNVEILKILSIVIPIFGIPLSIIAKTLIGIIGSICLGLIAAGFSLNYKSQQPRIFDDFLVTRKYFNKYLKRWNSLNNAPDKMLESPKISTAQVVLNPKVNDHKFDRVVVCENPNIAHKFDRVVVCDNPNIAQLLIENNFHFENNCAVMAIDRYPQHIFMPMKEMLDLNPELKVFALHDCSPQGLRMIRHLRTEKIWFPDLAIPIISAGILPRHIMNDPSKIVAQSAQSLKLSQQLAPDLRNILDPDELAWLDRGSYLELESFSPQELMQILQGAIHKSYQLSEIEAGEPIVMISPGFYIVKSLVWN